MKPLLQHKDKQYQERCLNRWKKLIEASGNCDTESKKINTALVLESTNTSLLESGDSMGAGADGEPGRLGSSSIYPSNVQTDKRIPSIVIPTLTRTFPELIAHDLVGVQPMDAPVGIAFAYRRVYGKNRAGEEGSTTNRGEEIGYDTIDPAFTGATGLTDQDKSDQYHAGSQAATDASDIDSANDYWSAFSSSTGGTGANMEDAEFWRVHEDWPTAEFRLEKAAIEAKTRKLASSFSLELQEDLMKMHGIDIDSESVKMMQWDIKAEIDRQMLGELVKATINGGNTSVWDPTKADGRTQIERIGTLYTQILLKSQQIAVNTRRGSANWCVSTPTLVALMERLKDHTGFSDSNNAQGSAADTNTGGGVAKAGTLRQNSISLYRDTFAAGDYVLLGYKGANEYDAGCIYCPYIPIQVHRAPGDGNDWNPRIGLRTRYGIMGNLYGTSNYQQMMRVENLNADLSTENQVFLQ